jgi:cyanate permease
VASVGWRAAYAVIGGLLIAVTLPVVSVLLVERPEAIGLEGEGQPEGASRTAVRRTDTGAPSAKDVLRTSTFWLIVLAFCLNSTSVVGCLTHLVPLLVDRGVSAGSAALAASTLGAATLLGRLGIGYLLDRFFAPRVAIALLAAGACGIFLLWAGASGGLAFGAAFMLGAAGAVDGILPYLITRYFGLEAFGQVYGTAVGINVAGWVSGPLLMGLAFDRSGSYAPMLAAFLAAIATAVLFLARLSSQRPLAAAALRRST